MRAAIENERREINQMDKGMKERGRVIYIYIKLVEYIYIFVQRTKNGNQSCFNININIFLEKKKV